MIFNLTYTTVINVITERNKKWINMFSLELIDKYDFVQTGVVYVNVHRK